jgi:hypothetical protein
MLKTISRQQIIAESIIRDHIRERISLKILEKNREESAIRTAVRMLLEVEAGTDEASEYTGINVLASLLEKVIPIIEDNYKMLTTSPEQRESFRNHIVHAIKNTLRPIEANTEAENIGESQYYELDIPYLAEKMKIDMSSEDDDTADYVEGDFIDIDAPEEKEDFVTIDDQNETGRNFAATTFKAVEKQIVDAYDMLADEKDQDLFYEYLITNMLLYFDKFEDELEPSLPSVSTQDYEEKKEEEAAEVQPNDSADQEGSEEGSEELDLFS